MSRIGTHGDADRRHPLHDALCLFLTDTDVAEALLSYFWPRATRAVKDQAVVRDSGGRWDFVNDLNPSFRFSGTRSLGGFSDITSTLEQPVHATRGRYNQIVGYVDGYISGNQERTTRGVVTPMWGKERTPIDVEFSDFDLWRTVAVEVKARISSVGDLVRQVQKYRHEWGVHEDIPARPTKWVVMSPSITEPLRKFLADQDIIGMRPGDKFLPWCQQHGISLPKDAIAMLGPQQLAISDGAV